MQKTGSLETAGFVRGAEMSVIYLLCQIKKLLLFDFYGIQRREGC